MPVDPDPDVVTRGVHDVAHPHPRRGSLSVGWFAGPPEDPDRFELLGPGLAGGEGDLWRARYRGELTSPLEFAVKQVRPPPNAPPGWPSPADRRRWEDQRALLRYVRIDHLVAVVDVFVGPPPHLPDGPPTAGAVPARPGFLPYVVMEWVPGPTLAELLSGVPATAGTLDGRLAHVQHVAQALHGLHSRTLTAGNPMLHRDVKPANCIVHPQRGVVLVDVGTLRLMDDGLDRSGLHTPAYTAPEVRADPTAPRQPASDLYSLGALAYFCVVGADPSISGSPGWRERVRAQVIEAGRSAGVTDADAFAAALTLMLEPEPEQRPPDASAWARRLRALAAPPRDDDPPATSSRLSPGRRAPLLVSVGAVVTAALVLAGLVVGLARSDADPAGSRGSTGALPTATPAVASSLPYRPPPPPGPPPLGPLPPGAGPPAGAPPPGGGPGLGPPPGVIGPEPPVAPGRVGGPTSFRTAYATIAAPASGAAVGRCAEITGTSRLPPGRTLVLSVRGVGHWDPARHLQAVDDWERPSALAAWSGRHFIGLPGEPPGTRFRVEVLVVPLDAFREQVLDAPTSAGGDWRQTLPPGTQIAARTTITLAATPTC